MIFRSLMRQKYKKYCITVIGCLEVLRLQKSHTSDCFNMRSRRYLKILFVLCSSNPHFMSKFSKKNVIDILNLNHGRKSVTNDRCCLHSTIYYVKYLFMY